MSESRDPKRYFAVRSPDRYRGVYHVRWEQFRFLESADDLELRPFDNVVDATHFDKYGHAVGDAVQSCPAGGQWKEGIELAKETRREGRSSRFVRFQQGEEHENNHIKEEAPGHGTARRLPEVQQTYPGRYIAVAKGRKPVSTTTGPKQRSKSMASQDTTTCASMT